MSGTNSPSDSTRTPNGVDTGNTLSITDTDSHNAEVEAAGFRHTIESMRDTWDASNEAASSRARDVQATHESGYPTSEPPNTAGPINEPAPAPASDIDTDLNATIYDTDPYTRATRTVRDLRPLIKVFTDETGNLDWHFQGLQARPARDGSEHGSFSAAEPELVAHVGVQELQAQGRVLAEQLEVVILRAQGLRSSIHALNRALQDMDG